MKRLLFIIFTVVLNTGMFCSCGNISEESSFTSAVSVPSENLSAVSEQNSSETSEQKNSYNDSFFPVKTFIKCGDVSDMPNYESIYKFNPDGTMSYSVNIYEGFCQADAKYFTRRYSGKTGYEIWYYYNGKIEYAQLLFNVDDNNKVTDINSSPTGFIDENEFNKIYAFHTDWNNTAE